MPGSFALVAFLAEARKRNMLTSSLSGEELLTMFATHYKRRFVSRAGSKAYWLRHDGRYIRRPPIAQHRVTRIGSHQVEYLTKDTRNKQFVSKRYTNEEFVNILIQHVPDRGRHAMRYFGLLSPRSKAQVWASIFVLLNQRKRERPRRFDWSWLRLKTFGDDPLQDSLGRRMHWVGRRAPVQAA